jgi:hypothetical protein
VRAVRELETVRAALAQPKKSCLRRSQTGVGDLTVRANGLPQIPSKDIFQLHNSEGGKSIAYVEWARQCALK